jgi:putative ABC transport system substrate-binding protein
MRKFGYVDGKNVRIEYRFGAGDVNRLRQMTEEAVRSNPHVLVSGTSYSANLASKADTSIPVVSVVLVNPIGYGLVQSYSHPRGNVTGILNTVEGLPAKQLEVGVELMSGSVKTGILVNSALVADQTASHIWREAQSTARSIGLEVVSVEVSSPNDLDEAFEQFANDHVRLALVLQDLMFLSQRRRIAELALRARVATVFGFREHTEEGGLVSYGVDLRESWARAAVYADKILKGARVGDLPVEFPAKLELVINLRTARLLGLTVPASILARADEVIE